MRSTTPPPPPEATYSQTVTEKISESEDETVRTDRKSLLPFALPILLFAFFVLIGIVVRKLNVDTGGIVQGLLVALVGQTLTVLFAWWSRPTLFRPLFGRFDWRDLFYGFRWGVGLYLGLFVISLLLVSAGLKTEASDTSASIRDSSSFIVLAVLVTTIIPFVEELFFRGVLASSIRKAGFTVATSIIFSGVVFGLFHFQGVETVSDLVVPSWVAVNGMVLAWVSYKRNSIWAPFAAHATYNALTVVSMMS